MAKAKVFKGGGAGRDRFDVVNGSTGEHADLYLEIKDAGGARKRWRMPGLFFMLLFDAAERLAAEKALTGEAFRVLFWLISQIKGDNRVLPVTQDTIAKATGMQRQSVNRAVASLAKRGIVEIAPGVARVKSYRVSLDLGWFGDPKLYAMARAAGSRDGVPTWEEALAASASAIDKGADV